MSRLKTNAVQLGDNATATQNFTLRTNNDGTMTLARGNVGATTQDILTVSADGNVKHGVARSIVRLAGGGGFGSTNIATRRFSNLLFTRGTDITYADSATLGATFTITVDGVYSISYTDQFNSAAYFGVSFNTTQPATSVAAIAQSERLAMAQTISANAPNNCAWCGWLDAGSVIRAQTNVSPTNGLDPTLTSFSIGRIG